MSAVRRSIAQRRLPVWDKTRVRVTIPWYGECPKKIG